jgi:hypothetical protein
MTQLIKSTNNPGTVAITTIVTRSGIESLSGETTVGFRIGSIPKDDLLYALLGDIQKIQDGEVHLFVKSIFKRKRWFDKFIQINGYYETRNKTVSQAKRILSDQDVSHEINLYGLDGCSDFEKYDNGSIRFHPENLLRRFSGETSNSYAITSRCARSYARFSHCHELRNCHYIHYSYVRIVSNIVVKNNLWMDELYLGTSMYNMDKIIIYELDYDNTYIQLTENDRVDLSL